MFSAFFLPVWLCGSGVGFAPPRWLAPAVFPVPCPSGFRPWLRCSVCGLCGVFVFLACSAAGRARSSSRLSSRSVSFPLLFFIIPHFYEFVPYFFGIFICLFCAEELSIARLSGGGQAPTTPHSQKITKLPSHWLKHNHSNGCSQAKLEPRKRVYNKLSRCQISIFGFYSLRTHNQNHPQKPKHYKLSSF